MEKDFLKKTPKPKFVLKLWLGTSDFEVCQNVKTKNRALLTKTKLKVYMSRYQKSFEIDPSHNKNRLALTKKGKKAPKRSITSGYHGFGIVFFIVIIAKCNC